MSSLTLDPLPNEIFERIVCCLSFDDIQSLRLVDRSTAHKVTQDTFRSFFRNKHVDLTRHGLTALVRATSQDNLGSLVENLTLIGIVYDPSALEDMVKRGRKFGLEDELNPQSRQMWKQFSNGELKQARLNIDTLRRRQTEDKEFHATGSDAALLTAAFANLATGNKKSLKSLSLQIAVYQDNPSTKIPPREVKCWRWVSEAASNTFILAMSCLRESRLPLQALDIFAKKPESLSCNLPSDTLNRIDLQDAPSLATITTLSIGISDAIINQSYDIQNGGNCKQQPPFFLYSGNPDFESLRAQIIQESRYSALSRMIEVCQNLEQLDISGYTFVYSPQDMVDQYRGMQRRYLHYLTHIKPLPKLRKLRLAGLDIADSDLVTFLSKHSDSLRDVELNNISMTSGSWAPIMSYLPSEDMKLDTIHLEDLLQREKWMHFAGERAQNHTEISGAHAGRSVIKRWGPDTKKEILFGPYQGRSIGSGRTWKWQQRRRAEFGH